jgi:hypothetical protein
MVNNTSQGKNEAIKSEKEVLKEIIQNLSLNPTQKNYLVSRLLGQIDYMENKASSCKKKYVRSQIITILGGVTVTALVGLSTSIKEENIRNFVGASAFFVSQVVTVTSALEQLHKNNELWLFYRRSEEYMKSQLWHFVESTGSYENLDQDTAFRIIVKQAEEIIPRDLDILSAKSSEQQTKNEALKQN